MILKLENTTTHQEYEYNVVDTNNGEKLYFKFDINTLELVDGEYNLTLYDGDNVVCTDLLRIGDFNPNTLQYKSGDNTYIAIQLDAKIGGKSQQISTITSTIYPDDGFDGMDSVNIDAQPVFDNGYHQGRQDGYNDGKEQGIEEQKSKLIDLTVTENGTYEKEDGYSRVIVEVDTTNAYNEGKADGFQEGIEQGKADGIEEGIEQGKIIGIEEGKVIGREEAIESLPSLVIEENGLYEGAYKNIEVNVPQTAKISVKDSGIKFGNSTFTTVPDVYDFNGIIDMSYMFADCGNLQTIPPINTSEVTNMSYMFYYSGIKYIPYMDTRKVTTMNRMFSYCGIESLPEFDCTSLTNIERLFQNSGNELTECGGWKNLKINWTDNYGLSRCSNLSYQSCINVLNGLYDFRGNGDETTTKTLKVHQNFLDAVGDEISIGTNKGWIIQS